MIIYVFLRNWGATLTAAVVIPTTVLITLLALRVLGLGFNLMTLGGIAAAIGLIIDDAIVVVEAVYAKISEGTPRLDAVPQALGEILRPLLASTLTPVVVFIPLAFLDGVAGTFFRALALTMVVSLLASLVLAVTLIPALAAWWMKPAVSDANNVESSRHSGMGQIPPTPLFQRGVGGIYCRNDGENLNSTDDGLETTGPSLSLRLRNSDVQRFGLTANDIAVAVGTAMLGQKSSYVLEGDRVVNIRVRMDTDVTGQISNLRELPVRAADGTTVKLSQLADVIPEAGQLELHREDLRQLVAVSARLEGRDLGSAMSEIQTKLGHDKSLPVGVLEFGGLFQQQQESFHNLIVVLLAAVFLVFTVLLIEFRSFHEPVAIVFGSVLALCGTIVAWYLTDTSVNIVSLLGAIIGIGVVAKNGILMLDSVHQYLAQGLDMEDALVASGQRRLRPVLMTSLAAALGLMPLAYGIGAGSDMLRPLAIAVIGALCLSVLLSLIATPTAYYLMSSRLTSLKSSESGSAGTSR